MKRSKCDICDTRFAGSTSRVIKRDQRCHYDETGHRRFIGIVGFGNYTFDPHPLHPNVSQERQNVWVPEQPEEVEEEPMEVTALTLEEMQAELRGYVQAKELAAWKKDVATKGEVQQKYDALMHTITGVEQSIQAGAYGDTGKLSPEVKARLEKVFGTLDARTTATEDKLLNMREVLNRFKDMEKNGFPGKVEVTKGDLLAVSKVADESLAAAKHAVEDVHDFMDKTKDMVNTIMENLDGAWTAIENVGGGGEPAGFLMDAKGEKCYQTSGVIGPARKGDIVVSVGHGGDYIASTVSKTTNKMRVHLKEYDPDGTA